jgi:hypothetical protein
MTDKAAWKRAPLGETVTVRSVNAVDGGKAHKTDSVSAGSTACTPLSAVGRGPSPPGVDVL